MHNWDADDAKRLLVYYFGLALDRNFDSTPDMRHEIEAIVDYIIDAAVAQMKAETEAHHGQA